MLMSFNKDYGLHSRPPMRASKSTPSIDSLQLYFALLLVLDMVV